MRSLHLEIPAGNVESAPASVHTGSNRALQGSMASSPVPTAAPMPEAVSGAEIEQYGSSFTELVVSDARRTTGRLIVITGPSGVGKGTLLAKLRYHHPDLGYSISATTRSSRAGEVHGQHYFFVSREEFLQMREAGELLEWAEYAGNFYGTPLQPVQQKIEQGEDIVLEIELVGARQVAQSWPDALKIFIQPPSLAELEHRIRDRAQDDEASIKKRLVQAEVELAAAEEFDCVVTNDNLERALNDLEEILFPAK
ncbi:MAG: guanylate kinase [Cyanobacteria bacterium P01_E01_bin.48]